MARRSNYAFERNARAKAKAEKREAKRLSKLAARKTTDESIVANPESSEADSASEVVAEDSQALGEKPQRDDG